MSAPTRCAIQVSIDTKYTSFNVYVNGFDDTLYGLELVFAGYAYVQGKADTTIELIQKEYTGTAETPIEAPMQSLVVRGDDSLYTVTLGKILKPAEITAGKVSLTEYQGSTDSAE